MNLALNDTGEPVKVVQRHLNKLGSMLTVDGQFGPSVQAAVVDARASLAMPGPPIADDALQAALEAAPDPFVAITAPGATFIARAEVTSPKAYRDRNRFPSWPSADSGITIGIGYDLSAVSGDRLRSDWAGLLSDQELTRLSAVTRVEGSDGRLASVRDISVPLTTAMTVFARRSLPAYLARVRRIYPQVDDLSAPRQTSLVSLVYNRGAQLDSDDPRIHDARREMRTIRDLLAANDPDAVADQFESMTRLWDPQKLAGLVRRRRDEATLWRSGFTALQLA